MSQITGRPDIQLFAEHLSWLGEHGPLRDASRLGVLSWLARRVTPSAQEKLRRLFLVDHPALREAEGALLALLARSWQMSAPRYRRYAMPERNVDWSRTYLEALAMPPTRYWAREATSVLDLELVSALATLAGTIKDILTLGEESGERRGRHDPLAATLARLPPGIRSISYTSYHEQRLLRADDQAKQGALAIRRYLSLWNERFGGDDRAAFARIGKELAETDIDNIDSVLELTATLSIVRAALLATDERDVLPEGRWQLEKMEDVAATKTYPAIVLRAGKLRCRIGKDAPKVGKKADDRLNPILRDLGYEAHGNQPDIVLSFWNEDCPGKDIVILADAKRNATRDGEGYLRVAVEVAAAYAVSYGHRARLRIHAEPERGFDGPVLPVVTLFCRQGVKKVAGIGSEKEERVLERLRDDQPLPAIMAFDLKHHFGLSEGTTWSAPVLSAWFGRLTRQVWNTLGRC